MPTPFSLPSEHRLVGTRRWGRVEGITLSPLGDTRGRREFLHFRPGFYASLGDVHHLSARCDTYPSGDFIKLHFRLSGASQVGQAQTRDAQYVAGGTVSTLLQPRDSFKEEVFDAGVHERSLTLCCSRHFLQEELGLRADEPGPLSHYLQDHARGFVLRQSHLRPEQASAAAMLLDSAPEAPHRALLAEAKAFELLHSFLTPAPAQDTSGVPCALQERFAPVQTYLQQHLSHPLSMQDLVQHFGMSESRLTRGFREAFGMPVFQYLQQLRLQRAHHLLQTTTLSVTDIAFNVGYNHVANFSTAFKRCYGISPHALRHGGSEA